MLAAGAIGFAAPLAGWSFETRRIEGLLNLDVSYGAVYRTEDRDDRLIGRINGGTAPNVNGDDGNLNFDDGLVSSVTAASAELIVGWQRLGFYARGSAFYDSEQQDDLERTELTAEGRELVGSDADLTEYYAATSFSVGDTPIYARIGDQVVGWNESNFLRDGVDLINALDTVTATRPTSQGGEARRPQGMLWLASSLSTEIAVEAYYQYEWRPVVLPPVGSYFSPADLLGGDRVNAIFLGGGGVSDLGTDLDAAFGLPSGTLGFDRTFDAIPGRGELDASDEGQFGVSVVARFLDGRATKLGLHYFRYHSRLPLVAGLTADAAAVAATANANVEARADALQPVYEGAGLDPAAATARARATAEALTISDYAANAGYFTEYPEDIDAFAATFSFSVVGTGTLVAGEIAHHRNAPYQLSIAQLTNAALSPVLFDPTIGSSAFGEYPADTVIQGYRRAGRTQGAVGVTQLLGPRMRATQVLLALDLGWVHAHDLPDGDEVPLEGAGEPTSNSYGVQLIATATYSSVLGVLNVAPRIVWGRDTSGVTPGPTATFVDGRTRHALGIAAEYLQRIEADLSYVRFGGAGAANKLRDRDYVQLRLTYTF